MTINHQNLERVESFLVNFPKANLQIVTKNRDEWNVELNNSTLPKVCVNDSYVKEIEKLECKDSDKKYIIISQIDIINNGSVEQLSTIKNPNEINTTGNVAL